jgi:hypothetical protein
MKRRPYHWFLSSFFLSEICTVLLLATSTGSVVAAQLRDGIRLQPLQSHIYKTRDPGNEHTESWTFWLLIETTTPMELKIESAKIALLAGNTQIRTTSYDVDGVRALTIVPPFPPKQMDGSVSPTPIFWPLAIRVRCTEAEATKVDGMHLALLLSDGTRQRSAQLKLAVETYVQKTSLISPFQGKGIVTNAGITNGGHRNRSGQFALDMVGLDANYGVYVANDGKKSEDYADWGRTIVAPAAGRIIEARADRPDQPDPENSDPKYFTPEYPRGGDPGNHVVIDHGNGEFSLLAHFQAGSVRVKIGDRVQQGEAIGKLGSSGDTNTPHLHYQLQSGPDIVWSDGLPVHFSNIDQRFLVRGTYFEAK